MIIFIDFELLVIKAYSFYDSSDNNDRLLKFIADFNIYKAKFNAYEHKNKRKRYSPSQIQFYLSEYK